MAPPFEERAGRDRHPSATPVAPPRAESSAPLAQAPPEPEPPRRRSTIREPAPFAAEGAPPPPAPTLPPPTAGHFQHASEESGTPKRGWWAKRLSGDKD